MRSRRFMLLGLACSVVAAAMEAPWRMPATLAAFEQEVAAELKAASAARERVLAVTGARTVENTLVPVDEIQFHLGRADASASAFLNLHPDAAWRAAGARISAEIDNVRAELSLDRGIYDALAAMTNVPEDAKWYVARTLANSKRSGVLLPDETRKRIAALRRDLTKLEQKYRDNLAANRRQIRVPAAQLDSMPADFLKSHPADAEGMIVITNDAGDHDAVMTFAQNADVRRRTALLFRNRGYPENQQLVRDLIRVRHELGKLTGFANFAEYAADSRMVGTVKRHHDFLRSVERATESASRREMAELLAQKKKDFPDANRLNFEDTAYYERLVREAKFRYDVRQAREYFPYAAVKEAVLGTASAMFGIEFRPLQGIATWHPSVEVYEVVDGGTVIGRFYLDMHPRANKFQHFAAGSLRSGVAGRQLPEALLLCNFPNPAEGPALIEPDRARTFFHEFGHLLHSIFAGHQRWAGALRPESDFIEAPSQLLEEWLDDPELLVRFTKHYKTGERMPIGMARTLIEAKDFGKARRARGTAAISTAFLDLQDDPEPVTDVNAVYRSHAERLGLPVLEGAYPEMTISHMGSSLYAAAYYTYLWSQVLAKDMFTKFDRKNLLSTKVAREYRRKVLEPGGTKPAAVLVEDFLGRPWNVKAFEAWLAR